jgi:hypothetical protein
MKQKTLIKLASLAALLGASVASAQINYGSPCQQCSAELYQCIDANVSDYSCYANYEDCMIGNGCTIP